MSLAKVTNIFKTKMGGIKNKSIYLSILGIFSFANKKYLSGVLAAVGFVGRRTFHPIAVGLGVTRGLALCVAHGAAGRLGLATTARRLGATGRFGAARRLGLAARRFGATARRLGLTARRFRLATRRLRLATGRLRLATGRARRALAARRLAPTVPHGRNRSKTITRLHMSQCTVMEMLGNKLIPR
jgi:hypothetical protein